MRDANDLATAREMSSLLILTYILFPSFRRLVDALQRPSTVEYARRFYDPQIPLIARKHPHHA
jgi:hypothetical protein